MPPVGSKPVSPQVFIEAFLLIFAASVVQGSVGFGANLLAMPIMVQIDPALVPGPTLLATALLNVLVIWHHREHINFAPISQALGGRIVGTGAAVVALGYLSQRGLGFVIAAVVLGAVALAVTGVTVPRNRRNMMAAGAASGFSATTAGIGGPPVALLFHDAEGPEIRGSLALYFLIGLVMTLVGLAYAGRFGTDHLMASLLLTPASVIGFLASRPASRFIDRGYARPAILILSTIAAVTLLARLI